MTGSLRGQVAIISGGAGDIGWAIALELASRGADIAVGDVVEATAVEPLLVELRGMGVRARYDRADVSHAAAVKRWVDAVSGEPGLPSLIVPNAAIVSVTPLEQLTPETWRRELAVNLDGAFFLAQETTRRLVAAGKPGRVVFIGSWAGHAVHLHIPTYCVGKAGMRMLTQCMAAALAPHGILVNEVAPGYVDAGLTGKFFREDPPLREKSARKVPTGWLIDPHEVAVQVAHLCEPANRHMVGSTLLMDGGLSLFGQGGRP